MIRYFCLCLGWLPLPSVQPFDIDVFPPLEYVQGFTMMQHSVNRRWRDEHRRDEGTEWYARIDGEAAWIEQGWEACRSARCCYSPADRVQYLDRLRSLIGPWAYCSGQLPFPAPGFVWEMRR